MAPLRVASSLLPYALAAVTVVVREGRFAGWSADASSLYLAREDGLFAVQLGAVAADPVRISPFGVVVSATGR